MSEIKINPISPIINNVNKNSENNLNNKKKNSLKFEDILKEVMNKES